MIKNRIEKNLKRLKSWVVQNKIEAYRIYDWDIPEYPFQIDKYGAVLIVHDKSFSQSERDQKHLIETQAALVEIFSVAESQIIIKKRFQQREKDKSRQYEKQAETNIKVPIQEGEMRFLVNLHDYIDTGLFLDHRPLRKTISQKAGYTKANRFLNLFAYTCSVSVAAAKAGFQTVSVDLSEKYLLWGKENFKLNELAPESHLFLAQSTLDFLKQSSWQQKFDLIFLDPPTFSNSKKMDHDFEVERDQVSLISDTMKLLKPDGLLIFSNNKKTFKLAHDLQDQFQIKDVSLQTIPMDFQNTKIHKCFEVRQKKGN